MEVYVVGLIKDIVKVYLLFLMIVLTVYSFRHIFFTLNRMFGSQRIYYHDIIDSDLPMVSVLIPMHNEERVIHGIMKSLINSDYPKDRMEIIPINDHSTDNTKGILDEYASKYSFIKPLHRYNGNRGKQNALNEAVDFANGQIIIVYDADYIVPKGQIKDMVKFFVDPEIGAVMGRVVPINYGTNLLTMILDLERSGGYQVDQQARYNLNLIPQYGGTVGAFRKDLFISLGKFDPNVLAEDTELTFKIYLNGYKVAYANRLECYEESPEDWYVRSKQIRRWSRGHNQVLFRYFWKVLRSKKLNIWQKIDGILLLGVYTIPILIVLGFLGSLFLFFVGDMVLFSTYLFLLAVFAYNSYGNFAPFFQIAAAAFIDMRIYSIRILPLFFFSFVFNLFYSSLGFIDALLDLIYNRQIVWHKTERFRK
ncbi:MAG: glycosyltransferase [Candidatus Calescibacterium sp.]|nr:glycosyltransferase family 2 protein [Candidatus Calescibacterium sp.]MDW8195907.1 glycosyltransferase [Candidatus Calescibacterium sp.]